MPRHRLAIAWVEMAGAIAFFLVILGIDLTRQAPRGAGAIGLSLLFTTALTSPLLFTAGQRLRRTLTGQADERANPPTLAGAIGLVVVGLAVFAALAPALIQL